MNYTISKENILAIAEFGNEAKAYLMKQFPEVFWKEGDYLLNKYDPYNICLYKFKKLKSDGCFSCVSIIYPRALEAAIIEYETKLFVEDFKLATEEEIKRFIPDYVKQDETPLEKAKRLYKKGTKFGSLIDKRIFTVGDSPMFSYDGCTSQQAGDIIFNDDNQCRYVFHKGQWAEIIEQ